MSFLDRIDICNRYDLNHFLPFCINGLRVGWVKHAFAEHLQNWPRVFRVGSTVVELNPGLDSFSERTEAVREVIQNLVKQGVIARHHGELYPVTATTRHSALLVIDRSAAPYFGIRAFGQHLNGFVRDGEGLKMWVGRRVRTKWNAPCKLDNMVAGGLPHEIGLEKNLQKECWEEAAIPPELAARALPTGAITYCVETEQGLKPDVIFCYDLELPGEFLPSSTDGSVESFYLWPVQKVAEVVRDTEEVKANCNLVMIDFMIRRGFIIPSDDDYLELTIGLRKENRVL